MQKWIGCRMALRSRVRRVSDTSRTKTARETVGEAVAHGSVVEGPSQSEGTDRNAMGEVRQAKGSQRSLGRRQRSYQPSSPAIHRAATGEQKLLGRKKRQQYFLQPLKASSTANPLKHEARKHYVNQDSWNICLIIYGECISVTQALLFCYGILLQRSGGKFQVDC